MDKKCRPIGSVNRDALIGILRERFDSLDWESAKEDVMNFIKPEQLGDWGPEPFKSLAERIAVEE